MSDIMKITSMYTSDSSDSVAREDDIYDVLCENPALQIWPGRKEAIEELELVVSYLNEEIEELTADDIAGLLLENRVETYLCYDRNWTFPDETAHTSISAEIVSKY